MDFTKLWENFDFPNCENCKNDCRGHLDYNNLCANLNYLRDYAQKNYEKNKQSLVEFQEKVYCNKPFIFSFGCGLGLDYIGAKEVFGDNVKYFGIDECDWAIKNTDAYRNFSPSLPKTMKLEEGLFLLSATNQDAMLCFFNSLFTISNNTDILKKLIAALINKKNFFIICDYTINSNYHIIYFIYCYNCLHCYCMFK